MPAPTMPTGTIAIGAGYLYWAPLGTTEPTSTVGSSQFTDAFSGGWLPIGYTDGGHTFTWGTTVDQADAAEALDPLAYATTGRSGSVALALLGLTATNFKHVFNGGTITLTGTGATTKSVYNPPDAGAEVRCMLAWEATDLTERMVWRQCFQGGASSITRNKGASNRASLPATFNLELPTTGLKIFDYITAGVARG